MFFPEISLFCGALLLLMLDVFFGKKVKNFFYITHLFALIVTAFAAYTMLPEFFVAKSLFDNMFIITPFTSFAKVFLILLLAIVITLSLGFVEQIKNISAEFLALLLISASGMMVMISANDFLVLYLALELQSLALYLLAALKRDCPKSSEAGVKYFVLGAVASGILLFGIAMIYGFSGTTNFSSLLQLYHQASAISVGVVFGFLLVIVAIFFKISAAPFHAWAPDVYEGSKPVVTTFFAVVAKFASVIVLIRLVSEVIIDWVGMNHVFAFVALTSLTIGSLGAIHQSNLKRLLAYSSIGHVGFILLGLASFNNVGTRAAVLYIIIYAILSLGNFGFLSLIKDDKNGEAFAIKNLSGLAKSNPTVALCLATLMFSTAGIPPLAGFFAKFYVLIAAVNNGMIYATIAAILFSVISAFYYLRIVKIIYFDEPQTHSLHLLEASNVKAIVITSALANLGFILILTPLVNLISNLL